jgi:hypothetical protein
MQISSSAFFFHLLAPISVSSFSIQSSHLNSGIPAFLLPSGFPRNTVFTVLSLDVLTRLPAPSSLLTFIVVTIFVKLFYCRPKTQQILISNLTVLYFKVLAICVGCKKPSSDQNRTKFRYNESVHFIGKHVAKTL